MVRDELWQAVKNTVTEVEELDRAADLEELLPTFEASEFKLHHLQMFQEVLEAKRWAEGGEVGFPNVIINAAEAWARRRDEAWTISEEEEQEDAKIRRRHSFGGVPTGPCGEFGFRRRRSFSTKSRSILWSGEEWPSWGNGYCLRTSTPLNAWSRQSTNTCCCWSAAD